MTKVKICGLMDQVTVDETVQAGADYLGFVFAKSKRNITPEKVRAITRNVPEKVKIVGVFVSPSLKELEAVIRIAKLDLVQIHGKLFPEIVSRITIPVIQSFDGQSPELPSLLASSTADFYLLDAPITNEAYAGSNGKTFDWQKISSESQKQLKKKLFFIAGGLTQDNVTEAIQLFEPFAVDVSSSVETDGVKDVTKIKAFIKAVKEQ